MDACDRCTWSEVRCSPSIFRISEKMVEGKVKSRNPTKKLKNRSQPEYFPQTNPLHPQFGWLNPKCLLFFVVKSPFLRATSPCYRSWPLGSDCSESQAPAGRSQGRPGTQIIQVMDHFSIETYWNLLKPMVWGIHFKKPHMWDMTR